MTDRNGRRRRDIDDLIGTPAKERHTSTQERIAALKEANRKAKAAEKKARADARLRREADVDRKAALKLQLRTDANLAKAKSERVAANAQSDTDDGDLNLSSQNLFLLANGVSIQWLAKAFGLTRAIVEGKVRGCRVVGTGAQGNPLFDLREAAAHLVEPIFDLDDYLSKVKPEKLPERLRESFWNAKLKEQRWKKAAGDLWDTEQVMTVFAEVLSNIRDKLQLIPDTVERLGGLDVKQWQMVRNLVDQTQEEIFAEMQRFADGDSTFSQLVQEENLEAEED
ncbi:DUF1441 family protein [Ochrobactrum sp. GPK 3]